MDSDEEESYEQEHQDHQDGAEMYDEMGDDCSGLTPKTPDTRDLIKHS